MVYTILNMESSANSREFKDRMETVSFKWTSLEKTKQIVKDAYVCNKIPKVITSLWVFKNWTKVSYYVLKWGYLDDEDKF